MQSFAQEIQGFSRSRLKNQVTTVTSITGRRHVERRGEGGACELHDIQQEPAGFGFVEDKSLDLQVGVVRPFLLLGNSLGLPITLIIGLGYCFH